MKASDLKEIEGQIGASVMFVHREGFEKAEQAIKEMEKHIEYAKTQLSCVDVDVIPKLEKLIVIYSKKILWLNFAIGMRKLVKDAPRIAAQVYKPFISVVEKGKKHSKSQSDRASKPRKTKGIDPETRKKRNQEIKAAFERWKGTDNAFDIKYGKKHKLSTSAIRDIRES
jgi:hypothetical protein